MSGRTDQCTDETTLRWLLLARRGSAYYARKLQELPDATLTAPSLVAGWSRKHIIAHVGYNARALARLLDWALTGIENPMYVCTGHRDREIAEGATLGPPALRHLFDHSAIALNVQWRDLPADRWDFPVRTAQGRTVPVSESVWMRTREVWIHAVDLDNGARFSDFPTPVLERLREEIPSLWSTRGIEVPIPAGPLDQQVQWMSGRGGPLASRAGAPPRWL